MKVKEIMTRDVVSIKPEDSAKDALALLLKMQISGLPVIDESGKLVGMFTEKDILSHILPSYIERVGRFIYEDNPKSIKNKFMELENFKIGQLMRKEVVTVDEDAACCEVARIMLTQKVRRIPVLNKEKKVVGIVAREDVVKAYTKEAGWGID
jgi:CBS-domain-containing membrane protein